MIGTCKRSITHNLGDCSISHRTNYTMFGWKLIKTYKEIMKTMTIAKIDFEVVATASKNNSEFE